MIARENDYTAPLDTTNQQAYGLAELLKRGGELEETMGESLFLQEQRDRLIALAKASVEDGREIQHFVGALTSICGDLESNNLTMETDFEQVLSERREQVKSSQASMLVEMEEENSVRKMREALGEPLAKKQKKDDDSDVELEVLESGQSWKCPITAALLKDPMQNKLCGHVYSKEGLSSILRSKKGGKISCPVAGCRNRDLTMDQCERDVQMELKVKRHIRRQEAEKQSRVTQDLVDSDED